MKHFRFYLKTGAIAGVALFIYYVLAIGLSFAGSSWFSLPYYALPFIFVFLKVRSYRRSLPEEAMAYDLAFRMIFLSLFVCSLTANVLTYVHDVYRPEFVQEQVKKMHQDFIDKGAQEGDVYLNEKFLVSKVRIPIMVAIESVVYAFFSLLLAIFLKKEKKSPAA
jgi:hypothetical protein